MFFAINPTADNSSEAFQAAAKASPANGVPLPTPLDHWLDFWSGSSSMTISAPVFTKPNDTVAAGGYGRLRRGYLAEFEMMKENITCLGMG
jgi:hypothetical protein